MDEGNEKIMPCFAQKGRKQNLLANRNAKFIKWKVETSSDILIGKTFMLAAPSFRCLRGQ